MDSMPRSVYRYRLDKSRSDLHKHATRERLRRMMSGEGTRREQKVEKVKGNEDEEEE